MIEIILFFETLKTLLKPANLFFDVSITNKNYPTATLQDQELFNTNEFQKIKKIFIDNSKISAQAILIKEIKGPTIYSQNSDKILPIASLTKIFSALLAVISFREDEIFIVPEDFNYPEKQTDFQKGEQFKRDDLLKAMLISSSNASTLILAKKYGEKNFVSQLNNLAKRIGLKNTFFEDPIGVSSNNVSSLNEIYLVAEYILENYPKIFSFSREPSFVLRGKFERVLYNTNQLIYKYKKEILGSKTGFTEKAGQCLIMLVKFENSPVVFVGLLNSKDRIKDGAYILEILRKYYNQ